jgi:hypothetical protein
MGGVWCVGSGIGMKMMVDCGGSVCLRERTGGTKSKEI